MQTVYFKAWVNKIIFCFIFCSFGGMIKTRKQNCRCGMMVILFIGAKTVNFSLEIYQSCCKKDINFSRLA